MTCNFVSFGFKGRVHPLGYGTRSSTSTIRTRNTGGQKLFFLVEMATAYKLCIYQLLSFELKIFLFATVYLTKLILQLPSLPAF